MAEQEVLSDYERGFIARVRAARALRFDTQEAFCISQKIKQTSYKVFETERLLPLEVIEQYCAAWGVTIDWLITGKGAGPAVLPLPQKRPRQKSVESRLAG